MLPNDFSINAGAAKDANSLAVCLTDFDAGDPYSVVLMYVHGDEPVWQRTDVRRELISAAVLPELGYVTLSDEGDVYFLEQNDTPVEKVPGMGVHSTDANGRGAATLITHHGNQAIVAGQNGQIFYRERPETWVSLTEAVPPMDFAGDIQIPSALITRGDGSMLVAGYVYPIQVRNEAAMEALRSGNIATYAKLKSESVRTQYGYLARYFEDQWERIEFPGDSNLNEIGVDPFDESIILSGTFGTAFKMGQSGEIEVLDIPDTKERLSSIVLRKDGLLVAAQTQIFIRYIGGTDWLEFPAEGASLASVFKLQAFDDVLWAIGSEAIYRYKAGVWSEITIPPEVIQVDNR